MTSCADGSCQVRDLSREEKRQAFNHNVDKAQETWKDLRNDLLRVGDDFFAHVTDMTQVEGCLHDGWDELIHAAKVIPPDSSEHDRLVTLIADLRELGPFVRRKKEASPADDDGNNDEPAVMPNGQQLWTDLPYLAEQLQTFWMNESMELPVDERRSLAVMTAKLCASGICSYDISPCALWLFKEALETDRPLTRSSSMDSMSDVDAEILPIADLLPACAEWLHYSNCKIAQFSANNCNPVGDGERLLCPGPLAAEAIVPQHGFSLARWLFWRRRLGDLYLTGDEQVAKMARVCFEAMATTGRSIGIEIPGERRYLERVYDALEKEVTNRGSTVCVAVDDIEIDPAWAIED
ncbi:hypothetical protein DCS_05001 [Drechmeria coniospora]|uniref:Uncharacterized protein n=1 Tax=Drechmeria coniospora TaxID=98403 RepID=A0A151GLM3_DRECN|nr:hypothetical protein DCS_05001 [Drechmeria coniospora]KYK57988.1 hypothetical protein DCS_05001 [Drechmeria coniospora]